MDKIDTLPMTEGTGIFVYCEQAGGKLRQVSYELLGKARELADSCGQTVTALVVGDGLTLEASGLGQYGADRVILVESEELAQPMELRYTEELAAILQQYRAQVLLLGATIFGRSLAPRLAARLKTGLTADCTLLEMERATGRLLQTRPAFGGNLMATIVCPDTRPQMATVRPRVFHSPAPVQGRTAELIRRPPVGGMTAVRLLQVLKNQNDCNIADADVLVSVGLGIGNEKNIALASELAALLGGTWSASRPLVDRGMAPFLRQVGQTGKTVCPKLYIACGISGSVQHMAGVAADTIVAVNTDPDAPIFQYAHYAVVADCVSFLQELIAQLRE